MTDDTGDDPVRTYTLEEKSLLTLQLEAIIRRVHAGELRERPLTLALLCDLHEAVFCGVRDHAGHIRQRGFGSEYLTFGPNRSVRRDDVQRELEALFARAAREVRAIADEDAQRYELRALELAAGAEAPAVGDAGLASEALPRPRAPSAPSRRLPPALAAGRRA